MRSPGRAAMFLLLLALLSLGGCSGPERISVPEGQSHLLLRCGHPPPGPKHFVQWTHAEQTGTQVIVTRYASSDVDTAGSRPENKYGLDSEGSLRIRDLRPSDAGHYACNGRTVAEVEVLPGIPAGTTHTATESYELSTERMPASTTHTPTESPDLSTERMPTSATHTPTESPDLSTERMPASATHTPTESLDLRTERVPADTKHTATESPDPSTERGRQAELTSRPGAVVSQGKVVIAVVVALCVVLHLIGGALYLWKRQKRQDSALDVKNEGASLQNLLSAGIDVEPRTAGPADGKEAVKLVHYSALGQQDQRPPVQDPESSLV
ncbi:leukosialin-like isoform X2 [Lepisosteus oculatus]|uniref:leukosialin-like isoform X2 n=1 Tax=Lepisosteus oculatus TaxID=7918 RepID=UPI0035F517BE